MSETTQLTVPTQQTAVVELKQEAERQELARLRAEADERAKNQAAIEAEQRQQIYNEQKAARERIEEENRFAAQERAAADRKAAQEREAEQEAHAAEWERRRAEILAEQEAEREKLRLEKAAFDKDLAARNAIYQAKRAQEDAERQKAAELAEEKDRALQAEWHRQEAEKQKIEFQRGNMLAMDQRIGALRDDMGDIEKYAGIASAIDQYMFPGRPIAKVAKVAKAGKRQGGVAA